MWRIALSMGLMFGAVLWSALAVIVVFLFVPSLWERMFGPHGAVFGAIGALALMVWGSQRMMRLADRLSGMAEGRSSANAAASVDPDAPADWQAYNAAIARNKRWAFYRRTQQFDRLRELEAEMRAERK